MTAVEGIHHTSSRKHHNQQLDLALDPQQCELAFAAFMQPTCLTRKPDVLYTFILHRPIEY